MSSLLQSPEVSLGWSDRPGRALLRLAWPITVSMVSFSAMTLASTAFVAHVGAAREPGDARAEQKDGDDRPAGVEAPVLELSGPEEGRRERRQVKHWHREQQRNSISRQVQKKRLHGGDLDNLNITKLYWQFLRK